jgi:hypothetical protein
LAQVVVYFRYFQSQICVCVVFPAEQEYEAQEYEAQEYEAQEYEAQEYEAQEYEAQEFGAQQSGAEELVQDHLNQRDFCEVNLADRSALLISQVFRVLQEHPSSR